MALAMPKDGFAEKDAQREMGKPSRLRSRMLRLHRRPSRAELAPPPSDSSKNAPGSRSSPVPGLGRIRRGARSVVRKQAVDAPPIDTGALLRNKSDPNWFPHL